KVQKYQYDGKEIIFFKTKKLKIHAPDECVKWTVDGEYGGAHHDVMIHVLERAIDICSPENPLFIKHEPKIIDPVEAAAEKYEKPEKKKKEKRSSKKSKAEKTTEEPAQDIPENTEAETETE
ncbi:MAG: hypothetical protein IJB93_01295, partial [Clostridia bacterium]|nr:hypothetical protein [Clostridia bacterium]